MQDSVDVMIGKMLLVNKKALSQKIKDIIQQIKGAISNNHEIILQANRIDQKNTNGFLIDFRIIDQIFLMIEKETNLYGEVTQSQRDDEKKIIYGKQIMDVGNVVVINDGNSYGIIEMALRNIIAGNTVIFVNSGFMYGTNQLLIQIIQSVLEQENISKELVQILVTENYEEILNNYANIDLVIAIGNKELQQLVLDKSKNKTITSGYENFEIYIEDNQHLEFIKKIVKSGLNIQIYLKKGVRFEYQEAILVDDLDEAIAEINYNGSRYSSAIFTKQVENAGRFISEIKSKIVTVNASPSIERIIDIKQSDLSNEKTIIYPLMFMVDSTNNQQIMFDK